MKNKSSQSAAFAGFAPPAHLSPTSAALWADLVPRRCRSAERLALLVLAFEARDKAEDFRRQLAETGYYCKSMAGKPTLHPLAKLEESARKEFAALWQRLGLTSSKLDGDYSKAVPGDPGVGLPDLEEQDAMLREMKAQNDALLDEMLNELAPPMET